MTVTARSMPKRSRMCKGVFGKEQKLSKTVKQKLIDKMISKSAKDASADAGLTYLGQMISHELIPSSDGRKTLVCGDVTPQLNLQSLYGDAQFQAIACKEGKFIIGRAVDAQTKIPSQQESDCDLIRTKSKAIIAERRNDENVLVSQLHLFWLRLHNKVVDQFFSDLSFSKRFEAAKAFVIELFHQVVVDDFLAQLLDKDIYRLYCIENNRYILKDQPLAEIPAEFSHGAYRFGHSMVRKGYRLKEKNKRDIKLETLMIHDHTQHIITEHVVEWPLFFSRRIGNKHVQNASAINLHVVPSVGKFTSAKLVSHIVELNLQADNNERLPGAMEVVEWIRAKNPSLAKDAKLRIIDGYKHPKFKGEEWLEFNELIDMEDLPIWLYVLIQNNSSNRRGHRVGKLGSIIIAEVLMNAIDFGSSLKGIGVANRKFATLISTQLTAFYHHIKLKKHRLTMGDLINYL